MSGSPTLLNMLRAHSFGANEFLYCLFIMEESLQKVSAVSFCILSNRVGSDLTLLYLAIPFARLLS